jgi:hypothetical protein
MHVYASLPPSELSRWDAMDADGRNDAQTLTQKRDSSAWRHPASIVIPDSRFGQRDRSCEYDSKEHALGPDPGRALQFEKNHAPQKGIALRALRTPFDRAVKERGRTPLSTMQPYHAGHAPSSAQIDQTVGYLDRFRTSRTFDCITATETARLA